MSGIINTITIEGNLVSDPEIRWTPSGAAVIEVRIASTQRKFDKTTNAWVDADTVYIGGSVWRQHAENLAESKLAKGMRVIITGRLKQRSYETRDGEKRTAYEIDIDVVAPVLRNATAVISKVARDSGAGAAGGGSDDIWSTPANDTPPFRKEEHMENSTIVDPGHDEWQASLPSLYAAEPPASLTY